MDLPAKRIPKKKSSAKRALILDDSVNMPTISEKPETICSEAVDQPTLMEPQMTLELPSTSTGTVKLG